MLNEEKGKAVASGQDVIITPSDLTPMDNGIHERRCPGCGSIVDRSFDYCPRCGRKL